jgi:DUF4097 and DUF4098 domain-containing protein YvlB
MPRSFLIVSLAGLSTIGPAALADAKDRLSDWCSEGGWGDRPRHCEVREVGLGSARSFAVDASPNGGIHVEGGDHSEARLFAKVEAQGATEAEARELAGRVQVETAGTIHAAGPSASSRRHWHVSYWLRIPRQSDLDLRADNGGIHISDVKGAIKFETVNGGVHLESIAGDVDGRTVNGGLHVKLKGPGWEGDGMSLRTSNGGVSLAVSEGYRAHLETGTVNGHLDIDFPVAVQGRIGKDVELDLGGGGAPIQVRTTNGGIRVRRLP